MTFHIRLRIRQHNLNFSLRGKPRSWLNKCLNLSAISVDWWPRAKSLLRSFITVVSSGVHHAYTYIYTYTIHIWTYFTGVENNARSVFLITNEGDERGSVSGGRWIQLKVQSPAVTTITLISRGDYLDGVVIGRNLDTGRIRGCVGEGGTRMFSTSVCCSVRSARAFSSTCFHIRMKLILFGKVPIASCCRVVL